jgi:hypothetical protein
MPPLLHPHLKRGLDIDGFHVKAEDIIEELPVQRVGQEDRAAKRQRIEKIASQYLQGRRPLILSAGLRGPFNDGWKNPWAKTRLAAKTSPHKQTNVQEKRHVTARTSAGTSRSYGVKKRTKSEARMTLQPHATVSPKTSRTTDKDLETEDQTYTLDEVEVSPATALLSKELDTSSATEFSSVDAEQCVQTRSSLTNPFWLRRPEAERDVNRRQSASEGTETSPTHSRSAPQRPIATRRLQLARPEMPLNIQASPARNAANCYTSFGASASMVISSPVKPAGTMFNEANHPLVMESTAFTADSLDSRSKFPQAQAAQVPIAEVVQTVITTSMHKVLPRKSSSLSKDDAYAFLQPQRASLNAIPARPSQESIQRSAEPLADGIPTPSSAGSQIQDPDTQSVLAKNRLRQPQHDLVTSPPPNSSTGFIYKKVGRTKWTIDNAPRSKPRAVNFNSSPALKTNSAKDAQRRLHSAYDSTVVRPSDPSHETAFKANTAEAERVPGHTDVEDGRGNDSLHDSQSLKSTRSSRDSANSTQAAMLLAQLEFQESTFPISWSQPQDNASRQVSPESTPAITPFSVFKSQMGQPQVSDSGIQGPPVSTQDLFAAASPFTFSTVKKKAEAPPPSNLRVALMPSDGSDVRREALRPSDDRIPLKEKNTALSAWSFAFEKGSQTSQTSLRSPARHSASDFETPQLDSNTSLEGYGTDGSLNFADRLLRLDTT